jgi:hypothetical protein
MKILLDTANVEQIEKAVSTGAISAVTTNNRIISRENKPFETGPAVPQPELQNRRREGLRPSSAPSKVLVPREADNCGHTPTLIEGHRGGWAVRRRKFFPKMSSLGANFFLDKERV